jgi:hypothetical protein
LSYEFEGDHGFTKEDKTQYLDAMWAMLEDAVAPKDDVALLVSRD